MIYHVLGNVHILHQHIWLGAHTPLVDSSCNQSALPPDDCWDVTVLIRRELWFRYFCPEDLGGEAQPLLEMPPSLQQAIQAVSPRKVFQNGLQKWFQCYDYLNNWWAIFAPPPRPD